MNIQRMRDLLKNAVIKFTGNEYIVLIGVENQAKIHYATAVKSMLYDAVNYGAQVKAIGKNIKKTGITAQRMNTCQAFTRVTDLYR